MDRLLKSQGRILLGLQAFGIVVPFQSGKGIGVVLLDDHVLHLCQHLRHFLICGGLLLQLLQTPT